MVQESSIYFIITERCNLSCLHCIRGKQSFRDMPFEKVRDLLLLFSNRFPNALFAISGGEPTLHERIHEILVFAEKNIRNRIVLCSNGTTDFFLGIKSLRLLKTVFQLSMDGIDAVHDAIRGPGAFTRLINSFQGLISSNVPIVISTTITRANENHVEEIMDALSHYAITEWKISPAVPHGCADLSDVLSAGEWNLIVDKIKSRRLPFSVNAIKMFDLEQFNSMSDDQLQALGDLAMRCRLYNCGSGGRKIYIYPDGEIYGCTCLKKFPFGNIFTQKMEDVFASVNAKRIAKYTVVPDSPCAKCRYIRLCNGGCIGMSLARFGELGHGDIRCPIVAREILRK